MAENINDGGAAFPAQSGADWKDHAGISLCDYSAAKAIAMRACTTAWLLKTPCSPPRTPAMISKAYSINGEDFRFTELGDALDALYSEGRLAEGEVYYECDVRRVELAEFMSAIDVLDMAAAAAYDELGAATDGAFEVNSEAFDELDAALKAWAKKHLSKRQFWLCIGKPRELKVTADQVTENTRND